MEYISLFYLQIIHNSRAISSPKCLVTELIYDYFLLFCSFSRNNQPLCEYKMTSTVFLDCDLTRGHALDWKQACLCFAAQLWPTLWDPTDRRPSGSAVQEDSPGKNTGVGCRVLLQGIFPTQGSNLGLPHCRRILHHLSLQGSPKVGVDGPMSTH